ncbi:alpha/beta hydrolase family protein [Nonomuraea sp. NPDC048916]|uniref:alpha/beta fold hydrolase n=1 Tax=Nonomuraea sp. NPDC048916 TaxID=3154232 RepID=UPI0033C27AC2
MTVFVLVHGAWHGPWAWDRVTPLLRRAGAHAITPALPLEAHAGLHVHADHVVAVLDALAADGHEPDGGIGDVVLVGHSYAGLVVRQAADQRPHLVDHVVLVDGWAGSDGVSLFDLAPEWLVTALRDAAGDGKTVPPPPPAAFGITEPADAEWLAPRLVPQALSTFTEATRLTGAVDRIPGTGIHCRPGTYPFDRFAAELGYRSHALDGPHDVMLSHPEALTRLLLQAAAEPADSENEKSTI